MAEEVLPEALTRAHSQAQFLVELLLNGDHDQVKLLLSDLPPEEVVPLLAASLIYTAETMKACFGKRTALKRIAAARQAVNQRGGGRVE